MPLHLSLLLGHASPPHISTTHHPPPRPRISTTHLHHTSPSDEHPAVMRCTLHNGWINLRFFQPLTISNVQPLSRQTQARQRPADQLSYRLDDVVLSSSRTQRSYDDLLDFHCVRRRTAGRSHRERPADVRSLHGIGWTIHDPIVQPMPCNAHRLDDVKNTVNFH